MNYPIIAEIAMGQGTKGQSVRAIIKGTGEDITRTVAYVTLSGAFKAGMDIAKDSADGRWYRVPKGTAPEPTLHLNSKMVNPKTKAAAPAEMYKAPEVATMEFHTSVDLQEFVQKRPASIIMTDLNWKFICRSVVRGSNVLLLGPTGTGKSQTAIAVAKTLGRELFYINLGATQDPRGTLIGNTHFGKEQGTFFNESAFVKAIQTPNTVILLDELSRAHPEAWNILMTILDPGQRYLRLDEAVNAPTIKVADGVSFIGTANIGNEYTATRIMDRALLDRFIMAEIPFLNPKQELGLISQIYPSIDRTMADNLVQIAAQTRLEIKSEASKISTSVSTRVVLEMAGLMMDGFTLAECAEVAIYPLYSQDGGMQSERTYIKQLVQKYIPDGTADTLVDDANNSPF
jgi:Holliday junction resolvasome RuvABC ATP-dependent DNA helicase subunit